MGSNARQRQAAFAVSRRSALDYDWEQGTSTSPNPGGHQAGDSADCREWDTEFYYDYVDPPGGGVLDCRRNYEDKYIEGMTIMYRFRFVTNGVEGAWKIDDVALSSDDENAGYYTSFNKTVDRSQ